MVVARSSAVRVLVTGASGYLGHELVAAGADSGFEVVTAGRRAADVELALDGDHAAITAAVAAARPDFVVHAAAMSSMAACEGEPERAMAVNGAAVAAIAAGCPRLVQVSTDLVFDGRAAPYLPSSAARPLGVYGRSKLAGEQAALAANAGAVVVRVPLLYGPSFDGQRGASDMLQPGRPLRLFVNEFRTPLDVREAARKLLEFGRADARRGIVHCAGARRMSRWEFARSWAAARAVDGSAWAPAVCADPARPRDVSLLNS